MTNPGWDDYVATDADTAVADVQDGVEDLATEVNSDPGALLSDQLDVIDAQSSANDAVDDQATADGAQADADWDAQQAQSWQDYADGSAADGLDDLAANAQASADSYSDSADSSYDDAASAEDDVSTDLADTDSSVADIDTSTYDDSSAVDDTSSYADAGSDASEY